MKVRRMFNAFVVIPVLTLVIFGGGLVHAAAPAAQKDTLPETTRLAALAKVWGLLKYYHPEVAQGTLDWDQALMDSIQPVIAADDYDSFNREIANLIVKAGDIDINDYNPATPATPDTEKLFKWIKDNHVFSQDVRKKLETMRKKHVAVDNYYVQYDEYVGNAVFNNEKPYENTYYPELNQRVLALFRYWNAINYFFPYREYMDNDWETVLELFIPRVMEASDLWEYHFALKEMTVYVNDGHAFLSSSPVSYKLGYFNAPIQLQYIDKQPVVVKVYDSIMQPAGAIREGDVITACQNMTVDEFWKKMDKYVIGAHEAARQHNMCDLMRKSMDEQISFTIKRGAQTLDVTVKGYYLYLINQAIADENGNNAIWNFLPGTNIGYIDMARFDFPHVEEAMAAFQNSEAIIFDMRNYPNVLWYYLAMFLNPNAVDFAVMNRPDPVTPGAFYMDEPLNVAYGWDENPDYYKGKVIILVNDVTMSRAEWFTMCLQTVPQARVIGSQTAGSDGNVTYITLPGMIKAYFTGLGVYYPDGTPTQRIGIVPDVYVRPTIDGLTAGRDEVLERAVELVQTGK